MPPQHTRTTRAVLLAAAAVAAALTLPALAVAYLAPSPGPAPPLAAPTPSPTTGSPTTGSPTTDAAEASPAPSASGSAAVPEAPPTVVVRYPIATPASLGIAPLRARDLDGVDFLLPRAWRARLGDQGASLRAQIVTAAPAGTLDITALPQDLGTRVAADLLDTIAAGMTDAGATGPVTTSVYGPAWGRLDIPRPDGSILPAWILIRDDRPYLISLVPLTANPTGSPAAPGRGSPVDQVESVLALNARP